jgi:hypothetical protein
MSALKLADVHYHVLTLECSCRLIYRDSNGSAAVENQLIFTFNRVLFTDKGAMKTL